MVPEENCLPLQDLITQRRSTKSFLKDRSIPRPILQEILSLGRQAPSGFNLQPWRFIVVELQQNKQTLLQCAFEQQQVVEASTVLICCGDRHVSQPDYVESVINLGKQRGTMTEEHAQFLQQTIPAFFKFHPSFESLEAWTNRQVMVAVAHLMLVAKNLGIDSCPMEGFVSAPIKNAFKIPEHWDVCCLLALGYAAEPLRQYGGRLDLDQLCYSEAYGQPFDL